MRHFLFPRRRTALGATIRTFAAVAIVLATLPFSMMFPNTPAATPPAEAAVGDVLTVAGDGNAGLLNNGANPLAAEFNFPWAVAVDSGGNVFVSDSSNHVIRKINAAGTTV